MKLWEVLKELEENPMKVFESSLAGLKYKILLDGETIAFEASTGKFTGLSNCRDWQEVKQSVPWQEALEAWANGKRIRCVIGKAEYIFGRSPYREFQDQNDYGLAAEHITKGTWYIED